MLDGCNKPAVPEHWAKGQMKRNSLQVLIHYEGHSPLVDLHESLFQGEGQGGEGQDGEEINH